MNIYQTPFLLFHWLPPAVFFPLADIRFPPVFRWLARILTHTTCSTFFEGKITIKSGSGTQTISSGEVVCLRNCMKFVANQTQEPLDILILRVSGLLASSYYEIITQQGIRPICLKKKEYGIL